MDSSNSWCPDFSPWKLAVAVERKILPHSLHLIDYHELRRLVILGLAHLSNETFVASQLGDVRFQPFVILVLIDVTAVTTCALLRRVRDGVVGVGEEVVHRGLA